MRRRSRQMTLTVAVVAALVGFGLVAFYLSGKRADQLAPQTQTTIASPTQNSSPATRTTDDQPVAPDSPPTAAAAAQPRSRSGGGGDDSFMTALFGGDDINAAPAEREHWTRLVPRIIMRLALAALLVAALAFRPRRGVPQLQRNPYVAQTQILLAVVASALMMIVGDSAARAFGIFAAASLVRFRTNIRDPKEITVLLISLAIGLATGVGRWELALTLALFVFPLLWVLEYYAYDLVVRAMQVTVKTRDLLRTQKMLIRIFRQHGFTVEVRQLDPPSEAEPVGCVVYQLNMNLSVSTDELSEEIMASDPDNVEGIEWEQKKNTGYIYQ
ncbi:MAG: DUF4956 domain-containing protein [Pyrinomonadaceae bacterium]